ncbi:MAG: FtsX-like permease family protein [Bacteroidales bacterium]|nr:FtsX-like permease family protein [Bacteroidales bacterium]
METYLFKVDQYFIPTLGLNLVAGRNFSEKEVNPFDMSVIVNEEFVSRMSFNGSPIGEKVTDGSQIFTIIGVVNNYQFLTSREKIEPMVLHARTNIGNGYSAILLKCNPESISNVIAAIKEGWKEINTKEELNYIFWDQELEKRYEAEERLSKIIMYASLIAIVVLTLGLFGLTVLVSAQRTNEIGIRKVNGASELDVLLLLNSDYMKWVIIAFILACPLAVKLLNLWLENFAYKTEINWWVFAVAGIMALFIALLTVCWHSWRAATRNPVESLKYE